MCANVQKHARASLASTLGPAHRSRLEVEQAACLQRPRTGHGTTADQDLGTSPRSYAIVRRWVGAIFQAVVQAHDNPFTVRAHVSCLQQVRVRCFENNAAVHS